MSKVSPLELKHLNQEKKLSLINGQATNRYLANTLSSSEMDDALFIFDVSAAVNNMYLIGSIIIK